MRSKGEGAKKLERVRAGELSRDQLEDDPGSIRRTDKE